MIIWEDFLPDKEVNKAFYKRFKSKAEELTVNVLRAPSGEVAAGLVIEQIEKLKVQKVVSTPLTLLNVNTLENYALSVGLDFSTQLDRDKIEAAEMGISEFDMGIAELGSIFQDASDLHTRLVSMLPPIHLAVLRTASMVESLTDALEVIEKACNGEVPPYLSFITGPSITADIERELTIGVHGPEKLIVLCIDKD
jgi:L-lactate dehydrogenase complex protein LldG